MGHTEWFAGWFDSPYYHLLYNHRDYTEADRFIGNLCRHLELPPGARIWDLACGKGRHSMALSARGYRVTGTDLSKNSISEANSKANGQAEFFVHDMREAFRENHFDAVMNLFTSIGYFDDFNDNFLVFKNVATALRPGGRFVVDFFNPEKVRQTPPSKYNEKRGELVFSITKEVRDGKVIKGIAFETDGRKNFFEERVNLVTRAEFLSFAAAAKLGLLDTFGNYSLERYDANRSDRMILIFEKTAS
jgi:SAM-dependent methyltransferase